MIFGLYGKTHIFLTVQDIIIMFNTLFNSFLLPFQWYILIFSIIYLTIVTHMTKNIIFDQIFTQKIGQNSLNFDFYMSSHQNNPRNGFLVTKHICDHDLVSIYYIFCTKFHLLKKKIWAAILNLRKNTFERNFKL